MTPDSISDVMNRLQVVMLALTDMHEQKPEVIQYRVRNVEKHLRIITGLIREQHQLPQQSDIDAAIRKAQGDE